MALKAHVLKGVLLVNLGSPESPTPKDVKPYLDEFLMDERVIDVPRWLRAFLVRGIILQTRPKKSAEAYSKIWWDEGSPLIVLSERFLDKVRKLTDLPVALGMRYGEMSIEEGMRELEEQGVTEILLVPLYPHYAMSSYETVVVKALEVREHHFPTMEVTTLPAFGKNEDYLNILASSIQKGLEGFDYDHLLFSYHGIPERHIRKSDPTSYHCKLNDRCCTTNSVAHHSCYRHQCFYMTERVRELLDLPHEKVSSSFQSRLGGDPWLKPYTDKEFERLAEAGVKNLAVVTPAFVSDCLETLEEIAMEGEEIFHEAGGKGYRHIPCLNDSDDWVALMARWIHQWSTSETLPV